MTFKTSFVDPAEPDRWHAVNDGVMGGVSAGAFDFDGEVGVFSGELSMEHGGGFASVRRAVSPGMLADSDGIVIRVRGDGRRYQCRVGSRDTAPEISYAAGFDTIAGEWLDVRMTWQEFEPVRRGHDVPNAPRLSPESINRLGFLLADRQAGPFRLEIVSIRAV